MGIFTAFRWDVEAGTVSPIGTDLFVSCCSDAGTVVYCLNGAETEAYRVGTTGGATPLGAGTYVELPTPAGSNRGEAIAAAPDSSRFVYNSSKRDAGVESQFACFRYSRASGVAANLKDVFQEPDLEEVFAVSRDTTRAYGRLAGGDVEFLVQTDFAKPAVVSATIAADGETLTVVFSEAVTHVAPLTLDLTEGQIDATYAGGNGSASLTYTLSFVVGAHETGTYELPAGAVEDLAGNPSAAKSGAVVNKSAVALLAPTVRSATISTDGRTLTLVFSESVIDIAPPTLALSGGSNGATYESGNNTDALHYALSRRVEAGETGTYALASVSVVDSGGGNPNAPKTGPVANRSKVTIDRTAPTVVSAKINAAGDTLTIVYNENAKVEADPKLALSGGAIAADYESGEGSKAIAYALSRIVTKKETGTYALVAGAVEDAAGNPLLAKSGAVTNDSAVIDEDDEPVPPVPPRKTEKRPNGSYANYYIDASFQQSFGIFNAAYGENGYYAFLFAYYSAIYRDEAGDGFVYGGKTGLTRAEAPAKYKDARYQQLL